jgi:hypothetical protein
MTRYSGGGATVVQGGGGPNPTDGFSLGVKIGDSNVVPTDTLGVAFTFPDANATVSDLASLGLVYTDTNLSTADLLLALGLGATDTIALPTDAASYAFGFSATDANTAPTETAALNLKGYGDTNAAPTDTKSSVAQFFLSASAGTSHVTSPANANGKNDGTSSTQQTAAAGATTETLTSSCGVGIGAGTTFTTAVYRGWFVATVPVPTSSVKIVLHSTTAAFADVTALTTTATLNSATGTFTFDLVAAGINTLAKLQSVQVLHSTTDAAAGVSPAVLTVDAGCVELAGVL